LTFLPLVHTEEVTGSISVSPTQLIGQLRMAGARCGTAFYRPGHWGVTNRYPVVT